MISDVTRKLLLVSKVKGVGKRTLLDLTADRLFYELPDSDLHSAIPELRSLVPGSLSFSRSMSAVDTDIAWAEKQEASILSPMDAGYPELLRPLKDRPALLFVRGNPTAFSTKAVAVVGTREPSVHGKMTGERVTKYLVESGWQVVSGLAVGLDTVAHETTLLGDGSTVAVLAHGLDMIYPRANAGLAERILEKGGLLVSEYPYGTPSFPGQFVERDRLQAGLARGVIMVQSGETGGSWHASRAVLSYDRWLMVPAPTARDVADRHPKSRGNFVMAEGTERDKLQILKCEPSALERVFVFRSKDDYAAIEEKLLNLAA
ncbi:DNA-processing protein DprA [Burkholderia territorii]|uniref:DNA-processing protein DprA n=1 Tax=Burkholderia territorii TaxID=1503055 RepID=UPI0012D8EEE8|nr:DNA-processing protein DprA [Burkholderia territorii]